MESSERWIPVLGWEGYYEVSNKGRVRSCPRKANKSYRILKPGPSGNVGYLALIFYANWGQPNQRRQNVKVHRIVLESFTGLKPKGRQTCAAHRNGNHLDNRWPENLYWADRFQNEADKDRHGRRPIGEKSCKAKLKEAQVREIYRLVHKEKIHVATLAKQYGVNRITIEYIRDQKTWKHLWGTK